MLTPEQFRIVYAHWAKREPFMVKLDELEELTFSGYATVPHYDYVKEGCLGDQTFRIEQTHGTITYTFFIGRVPIAWEGAFGVMRFPPDSYKAFLRDNNWERAFAQMQHVIDELTSPWVNSDNVV